MKRPLASDRDSSGRRATAPPDPLPWLEPEAEVELTSAATAPADRRRALRSFLITVVVIVAGSVGVVIGRSTVQTTQEAQPPATTLPETPTQPHRFDGGASTRRLTLPTSAVPTQPCRYLIAASADALHTDAAWWIGGVIDRSAQLRLRLDQAIRDDLVTVRDIILSSSSFDARRTNEITRLEAAISLAATGPCGLVTFSRVTRE
jgi:hypothetical protein